MKWLEAAVANVAFGWEVLLFFGHRAVPALAALALLVFALRAVPNHWLTRASGYALLVLGCAGATISIVSLARLAVVAQFGGNADPEPALYALASSPFCIAFGWMLAAGRKTLVLFLRRFGNEKLNDAVRDLIRKRCRARVRLVTLDDSVFSPAGPRWRGLGYSLMPPALALTVLGLVQPLAQGEIRGEGMFGGAASFILFILRSVSYVACASFLVLGVAAVRSHFAGRRTIGDAAAMKRVLLRLGALRSLWRAPVILAPMATVVSVSDSLWQAAVRAIGQMCDVAMIDITEPRPHICWELRTLRQTNARIVLVAQGDGLASWWQEQRSQREDAFVTELRELARSLPLVIYETPERIEAAGLARLVLSPATTAPS